METKPLPGLRSKSDGSDRSKLYEVALSVVADTRTKIIGSSNLNQIDTSKAPSESDRLKLPGIKDNFGRYLEFDELQLHRKRENFVRKHVAWLKQQHQCDTFQIPASARLRKIFMTEQLNRICPYGNCSALAETSFLSLYRQGLFPLELVYQFSRREEKDYSHAFVVMNRKENSELKATDQWGEDSIVVDAWVPAVFFADQFPALQEWLPGTFDMDRVYSVIRLESRLENAERPAVELKSEQELEEHDSSS